jgi:hypothetical protein
MNDDYQPIYPNLKRITNIVKFRYTILEIQLFTSIRVAVYLYNERDSLIEATQFVIQGQEYSNWGQDDKYIVNLIKQKIQEMPH